MDILPYNIKDYREGESDDEKIVEQTVGKAGELRNRFLFYFWCADDFGRLGQLWSVYPIMGDGLQDGYSRFLGSCCFVTNKLFVFRSMALRPKAVWAEFVPFVACRVATGLFTLVAMVVMVDGMGIRQDFICKVVVSGISLVLNYVLSKWFVFKKQVS